MQLKEIARNRTTLVIAHRLSTIADADQILVMDQGRIVERGTHAQLLAAGAVYAQMWERQLARSESDSDSFSENTSPLSLAGGRLN